MKHLIFISLLFAFGIDGESFAQEDQGAGLDIGLRGLRGAMYPQQTNSHELKKNQRAESAKILSGVRRLVPLDYVTIQAAIDASADGDTVLVSDGTYVENIRFRGKAIVVASLFLIDDDTSHIGQAIIDGSNPSNPDSASVVYFIDGEDTTSVLCGFTITGGSGILSQFGNSNYRFGGGIFCFLSGGKIEHNAIRSNAVVVSDSGTAGGIYGGLSNDKNLIIRNNKITSNTVNSDGVWGGGMFIEAYDQSQVVISGNIISDNVITGENGSTAGAGIACQSDGASIHFNISGNTISNNQSFTSSSIHGGFGGGAHMFDAPFNMTNNQIINNTVGSNGNSYGAGLRMVFCNGSTLENNIFSSNHFTGNSCWGGGMIIHQSSNSSILNNTIIGNTAQNGGGIFNWNTQTVVMNSILWGNAASAGPEIYASGGSIVVRYSDVQGGWAGEGNIDVDPSFVNTGDYRLSDSSLCIGAGATPCPPFDFHGNPRPDPPGSMPDIGACENPLSLPNQYILVPQYFSTIQAGIDAASDGEIVIVDDGTYLENINFKGKAITVASYYILDGDTNHVINTIIDGSQPSHPDSGSVVYFISGEDTNSVLSGFTIRGGTGTLWINQDIWRSGGGVFCVGALGATIIDNQITQNSVSGNFVSGGGVEFFGDNTFFILERNHIFGNRSSGNSSAYSGGADFWGNGLNARIVENVFRQDTVVSQGYVAGGAIWLGPRDSLAGGAIHANTFRENIAESTTDYAVGGAVFLAATMPMTISENTFEDNLAKSASALAEGGALLIVDNPQASGHGRKIVTGNQFVNNLSSSQSSDGSGGGIELVNTLATVSGNYFEQNTAQGGSPLGGAIRIYQSAFRLESNIYTENVAFRGGAVYVSGAPQSGTDMDIINNTIVNNWAAFGGGIEIVSPNASANPERKLPGSAYGVALRERSNLPGPTGNRDAPKTPVITYPQIINNTISGNTATVLGGGIFTSDAQIVLMNSIIWGDSSFTGSEIYVESGSIEVHYNDIKGGWQSGTGNIDVDPLFMVDYQLSDSSLCIGAGIDSIEIGGTWYYAPPTDMGGNPRPNPSTCQPDMGAWESALCVPGVTGLSNEIAGNLPATYSLSQSYPNPFNPTTTISYQLPRQSEVRIEIYNTLGQKVQTLLNDLKEPGAYEAVWDGRNDSGAQVGSGVYLYRMVARDPSTGSGQGFVQTRKMILMK